MLTANGTTARASAERSPELAIQAFKMVTLNAHICMAEQEKGTHWPGGR